tara:strand:- start:1023 stop:1964 length:942 start_codon:yes stop_codon:yes gene_type:complete
MNFRLLVLPAIIAFPITLHAADAPDLDASSVVSFQETISNQYNTVVDQSNNSKLFGRIGFQFNNIDHHDTGDDEGSSDETNIDVLIGYDMGNYLIALESSYTSRISSDPVNNNGLRDGIQNAIRIETKKNSDKTYGAYLLNYNAKDGTSEDQTNPYRDGYGFGVTYTQTLQENMTLGLVAGYMDVPSNDPSGDWDDRLHSTTYINPSLNVVLNNQISTNLSGYVVDGKEDFGNDLDNIDIYGYGISIDYKLNEDLTISLSYKYDDYDEPEHNDYATEEFLGLGVKYSFGSNNPVFIKIPNHVVWNTSVDGHLE